MKDIVLNRFKHGGVLFDGAMGSMLIAEGLAPGQPPEAWNASRPSVISDVHTAYLEAGADVIETNTFGGTPSRLAGFGLGDDTRAINAAGVRLANEAITKYYSIQDTCAPCTSPGNTSHPARRENFVALSIGPTGKMFPPVGNATEGEIKRDFEGMIEGTDTSVEIVLIETMFDIREALAALDVVKQSLPSVVIVTLTYDRNPRGFFTVMGNEVRDSVRVIENAGADVVGANCTLTSGDMIDLARILRESTNLPILCQPNAGQPTVRDGLPAYDQTPAEFADDVTQIFDLGINAVGGCCGTTPAFIREASARVSI
jgi:5-methyltetrahydrofolate--homocysteine methyltransferase